MNAKAPDGNIEPLLRRLHGVSGMRKLRGREIDSLATQ